MRVSRLLPLFAIPLVAGCMMPRPWKIATIPECPDTAGLPVETTLFITLRLPDCRKGILTRYRGKLRYAAASGRGRARLYEGDSWFRALKQRVDEAGKQPVIFIHGYNNTNEEAVERAEKIAKALGGRSVIALTWPSYGKKTGYFWDEANAEWALNPASKAIAEILRRHPGTIIIAHSMGSRLALRAIADLKGDPRLQQIPRLILASPDVDRDALVHAWELESPPRPVTMYVSRRDQPLSGSWRGHAYPRAGDSSWWVSGRQPYYAFKHVQGLEVIDTTDVDRTVLGHSTFIDVPEGAIDLCRLILGLAANRSLEKIETNYYRIAGKGTDDDCRRFEESG